MLTQFYMQQMTTLIGKYGKNYRSLLRLAVPIIIGQHSTQELAAHQVVISISTISFMTYLGLGSATAIRTSFYKGAGDWTQVRKTTVAGVHMGLGHQRNLAGLSYKLRLWCHLACHACPKDNGKIISKVYEKVFCSDFGNDMCLCCKLLF